MIQSNELRIGNIVQKQGEFFIVDFITIRMAHNYDPIPLINVDGFLHALELPKNIHIDYISDQGKYLIHGEEIQIKYLHQLQNLYFALTGTELNIKI